MTTVRRLLELGRPVDAARLLYAGGMSLKEAHEALEEEAISMAVTCDRCSKPVPPRQFLEIELDEYAVHVLTSNRVFRKSLDLCPDCLLEIVRNGTVVEDGKKEA